MLRELRTGPLSPALNQVYQVQEGSSNMNSSPEITPVAASLETMSVAASSVVGESSWRQLFLTAIFLGTCAVAMIGWLIALAWAAIKLADRLFF
jgi:CelD/BcsL family acetyltransferase involved in cellulose biosynthesis